MHTATFPMLLIVSTSVKDGDTVGINWHGRCFSIRSCWRLFTIAHLACTPALQHMHAKERVKALSRAFCKGRQTIFSPRNMPSTSAERPISWDVTMTPQLREKGRCEVAFAKALHLRHVFVIRNQAGVATRASLIAEMCLIPRLKPKQLVSTGGRRFFLVSLARNRQPSRCLRRHFRTKTDTLRWLRSHLGSTRLQLASFSVALCPNVVSTNTAGSLRIRTRNLSPR